MKGDTAHGRLRFLAQVINENYVDKQHFVLKSDVWQCIACMQN
jgi:hypothetical protein